MVDYLKLAWRNIWRNKRRTLITIASIFFGVLLSSFMSSMQEGSYAQYITTIVNSYSGHLQIHKRGYWDDKVINNSMKFDGTLTSKIAKVKDITFYTPRLESYALASTDEFTKGVMVMGIDPETENDLTSISIKIKEGRYLEDHDGGVLLGSALAKFLKLSVNDTLVLLGQGYHGTSAAGKYTVKGIVKQPAPELDRLLVYMDIHTAQDLFSMQGMVTSVVIMVNDNDKVAPVKDKLEGLTGSEEEVMDWKEMNSLLLKQIESDRSSGNIMKGVLYMIITFGILSTIMMMMAERKKEFGVLIAVGMKKYKLIIMLVLEIVFIGMAGVITGIMGSIPLIYYYLHNPIPLTGQAGEMMLQMGFEPAMFFSMAPSIFYYQALIIFVFTILIGLYPVYNISRLKIMSAIRN